MPHQIEEDRRRSRRFKLSWDLSVAVPREQDSKRPGALRNISSRGAFYYSPVNLAVNSLVDVRVRLPLGKKWLQYSARVVRVKNCSDGFGIALRFESWRPSFVSKD